jgi:hypothetical protein
LPRWLPSILALVPEAGAFLLTWSLRLSHNNANRSDQGADRPQDISRLRVGGAGKAREGERVFDTEFMEYEVRSF